MEYNLTQEEFDILSKYKQHYDWAIYDNVAKSLNSKELAILESIYRTITGSEEFKNKLNCPNCVLKLWKKLHLVYSNSSVNPETIKRKAGRPKKN